MTNKKNPKQKKPKQTYLENVENKRKANDLMVELYKSIGDKTSANNINSCFQSFFCECYDHKNQEKVSRKKSNPFVTCKDKFCHICNFIKSRKLNTRTYTAIDLAMQDDIDFNAFHLTLTIKNPTIEGFSQHYKMMNEAFDYLMRKNKILAKYCLGFQAGREVSQQPEAKKEGTLHPHIHVLLLMKPEFGIYKCKTEPRIEEIKNYWIKCLEIIKLKHIHRFQSLKEKNDAENFDKLIDITNVFTAIVGLQRMELVLNNKKEKSANEISDELENIELNNLAKIIAEVCKYPTKPADLQNMSPEDFKELSSVLNGKRMISRGGIVMKYYNLAKEQVKNDEFAKAGDYELVEVLLCEFFNRKLYTKKLDETQQSQYLEIGKNIKLGVQMSEQIQQQNSIIRKLKTAKKVDLAAPHFQSMLEKRLSPEQIEKEIEILKKNEELRKDSFPKIDETEILIARNKILLVKVRNLEVKARLMLNLTDCESPRNIGRRQKLSDEIAKIYEEIDKNSSNFAVGDYEILR